MLFYAMALAGCGQSEYEYRSGGGIGADLYSADMAQATRNLNTYFSYLCQQSDVTAYAPGDTRSCLAGAYGRNDWNLLVHTGFNDIDRRCDDYLAWLEQARLRRDFGVSQLNALGSLTNAILLATTPESAKAIGIVGQAFGYSQKLFTDIHTLINLGIENSTIKTIVSERRLKFRQDFRGVDFSFKPDAVYALRSYLRICMPYTITMDVNTYARATAMGTSALEAKRNDPAQIKASLAQPATANTGVYAPDRGKGTENKVTIERINKAVQNALCVFPDGQKGSQTAEAIKIYQFTVRMPETGQLSATEENQIINELKSCEPGFKNFLERYRFNNKPENSTALDTLKEDLKLLAIKYGANTQILDTDTLETLRPKIRIIKLAIGGPVSKNGQQAYLNTQYTPDLDRLLVNLE